MGILQELDREQYLRGSEGHGFYEYQERAS
jgi:hypothetical protein